MVLIISENDQIIGADQEFIGNSSLEEIKINFPSLSIYTLQNETNNTFEFFYNDNNYIIQKFPIILNNDNAFLYIFQTNQQNQIDNSIQTNDNENKTINDTDNNNKPIEITIDNETIQNNLTLEFNTEENEIKNNDIQNNLNLGLNKESKSSDENNLEITLPTSENNKIDLNLPTKDKPINNEEINLGLDLPTPENNKIDLNLPTENKPIDNEEINLGLDLPTPENNKIDLNLPTENKPIDNKEINLGLDLSTPENNEMDINLPTENKPIDNEEINLDLGLNEKTNSSDENNFNLELTTQDKENTEKIIISEEEIKKDLEQASKDLSINPQMVEEFFIDFKQQLKDEKEIFKNSIKNQDYETLHKSAHKLKGVALNLRLNKFAELLKKADELAKEKADTSKIETILNNIYDVIEDKSSKEENNELFSITINGSIDEDEKNILLKSLSQLLDNIKNKEVNIIKEKLNNAYQIIPVEEILIINTLKDKDIENFILNLNKSIKKEIQ